MNGEEIDERLAELAHRTAGVKPRLDFGARVLSAVHAVEGGPVSTALGASTWLVGWRVLPAAALAACAALVLAVKSADLYDDALASTVEDSSVELGW